MPNQSIITKKSPDINKTAILIDGSSYLYRAFHALPPLTNSQGEPTGAIYGVINMVRKIIKDYAPEYMAIVFDVKGRNFRHDLYQEYKANRPPMNTELIAQIKPLHQIIEAMGIPLLGIAGYEADDIIGTLAKTMEQAGFKVLIATGDKDFAQLVNDQITLIDTMNNTSLDSEGVKRKFGVKAEQIIDYLALVGDKSDNIPGVPGIGPKTAVKLLEEYGNSAEIIKHADKISGNVGDNLRKNLAQLNLAQELVKIKTDLKIDYDFGKLKKLPENKNELKKLFLHLEFLSWLKSLDEDEDLTATPKSLAAKNYHTILTTNDLSDLIKKLREADTFAFTTHTTSFNPFEANLVGISFSVRAEEAFYVPFAHNYPEAPTQLPLSVVLAELKSIFRDKNKSKISHDLKYDLNVLANYDIEVDGPIFDIMIASYVLNSTSNHDPESLALKYLGEKALTLEDVAGKGAKQVTFNFVTIDKASAYACENADFTWRLYHYFLQELEKNPLSKKIFEEIDLPLVRVLANIERQGVSIDTALLKKHSEEIALRIQELEGAAFKAAQQVFNLNSPKQLQEILFTKLGLPIIEKTPTGQPSTAEAVLQELALNFELPKIILEHRTLAKLKSTYTDALPTQINIKTQRIHTSYNQAITSTGRLSSTDPNLQNIPIRTAAGRRIRQAFVAQPGSKIVSADYSQIELRIMAHLSKDTGLLHAFTNDEDVHSATAAEIFAIKLDEVSKEQRRRAKAINFGLIYGMSAFGLAKQLGISREEAEIYVDRYFARYPNVKKYMDDMRKKAHQHGFVETLFGRKIFIPDINAQSGLRRTQAERIAINAPVQGTAADIIKIAMLNIDKFIRESALNIKMIMQVHDELVFEVAEHDVAEAELAIKKLMQEAVKLDVPILVEVGIGNNWDEAH